MKIDKPCIVNFYGCAWDAGWEFDCPIVIYSPVKRYSPNGGSLPYDILALIEDSATDLAAGLDAPATFCASIVKEFDWRGWKPKGFRNRRTAWHIHARYAFEVDAAGMMQTWLVEAFLRKPGAAGWAEYRAD